MIKNIYVNLKNYECNPNEIDSKQIFKNWEAYLEIIKSILDTRENINLKIN